MATENNTTEQEKTQNYMVECTDALELKKDLNAFILDKDGKKIESTKTIVHAQLTGDIYRIYVNKLFGDTTPKGLSAKSLLDLRAKCNKKQTFASITKSQFDKLMDYANANESKDDAEIVAKVIANYKASIKTTKKISFDTMLGNLGNLTAEQQAQLLAMLQTK